MTTTAWIQVVIAIIATILVCYGLYHEDKMVAFEEKLWKRIKSKFKKKS